MKGPGGYYQYYKAGKMNNQINKHYDNFKNYYKLLERFDKIIMGTGSRDDPARTCRDLFEFFPEKKDGDYWVDPNEGSPDDAFLVFCNRTTNETCVYAKDTTIPNDSWYTGRDTYKWIMRDIMLENEGIQYSAEMTQMKMLQLLSRSARQNVTYNCRNSFALRNSNGEFHSRPLKVMLDNENDQLLNKSTRKVKMFTLMDECKVKDALWHKAVVELRTKKADHLPIFDVATHDVGDVNEEFGLEIGPVCFS